MPRITMAFAPLMVFLLSTVAAQSQELAPAPGPGSATVDCTTYLANMADCLSYVEPGSNLTEPEKPCCGELAQLIKDQPICLCKLLSNSTDSLGIQIDVPRSLKLQTVCKIDAPSPTLCSVAGYPVAGFPMNPPISPGMSPEGATPSSEGSPGVAPSSETDKGGIAAYGIQFSHPETFVVCLAIALFLPMFFSC